jgi:endoglucanase
VVDGLLRGRPVRAALLIALIALVALVGLLVVLQVLGGPSTGQEPGDPGAAEPTPPPSAAPPGAIAGLRVQGNEIVNADGATVRLTGFNSAGAEYACVEGWGIFDGTEDPVRMPESVVRAMASWQGANTVRVPLNEQCWLGLGVERAYGGAAYQRAVRDYVDLLTAHGLVAVLDLHRSAPGDARSENQEQMPDRDHSPTFWREVATAYRDDTSVVFDLFNEPWPYAEPDSTRAWECWRDGGCSLPSQNGGGTYTAAGMDELVKAVRSTGARNVLALGGIHWAEQLDRWLEYRPDDPLGNLVASFHNYPHNKYCKDEDCYDTVLARVADAVPLYAGEIGPDAVEEVRGVGVVCSESGGLPGFSARILDWLDSHGAGWSAWTWNAWDDCYSLVTDYGGTPSPVWGQQIRSRLEASAGRRRRPARAPRRAGPRAASAAVVGGEGDPAAATRMGSTGRMVPPSREGGGLVHHVGGG